ncbi:AAA family ATPase [bacterium endosymbiont of Escarpia laminata]|nr:MAG: AAA family ATPase [bacterium endosymbiont of Escarpia laminata]
MEANNNDIERASIDQAGAHKALENLRMRLLDLTARNRLINFRHTKSASLRIIDELPNQLVETLLADTEMRFVAIPEPTEEELIESGYLGFDEEKQELVRLRNDPTAEEWAKHLGFATAYEVPAPSADEEADKHSDTAIQTLLYPYEMEARLKSLLQSAESAIQEMGANILYLAFGFLEWYDANSSNSARTAPLFLVPVRLHKGRLNKDTRTYEYTLSYSGEDIIPNLSLREKLRADFAMALPELDENTVPEDYISEVQTLIKDKQPRWRVRRYISLALLNFSKLLMYLDLDPARWPEGANIVDHPVVSRFLSGYGQDTDAEDESAGDRGFGEEYLIDEMDEVHANYPLIDDADSSQHSALIDAVDGKNLVIEGPPGTGKSQTITNLIAAAMAQGKRVLFVAEKLAALEVVRSRLDNVGLGEFCLELHSHKSQKRKVLDEVDERLKKNGRYRKPKDIEVVIACYEERKTALKIYAEKINRPWKNTGKTLHEIFMAATRYRNAIGINPEVLHPEGYDGSNYDAAAQRRNEDQVEAYGKVYQAVARQLDDDADLQDHPWYGVRNGDLQIFDLDRVKESLGAWQKSLQGVNAQRGEIAHTLGCDISAFAETLTEAKTFLDELDSIPALKGDEVLVRLPVLRGGVLQKTQRYLKLFEDIQDLYASLAKVAGPEILQDLSIVDQLLSGSEQLKQLVGQSVELGGLAEAINRLSAIEDQLGQLDEPLQGVLSALGEPAARHLTVSESGLTEFKTVIELIASLRPSHWKHRDELFDNEELDELLPQLRSELKELKGVHVNVHGVFSLESLPDESEIRQLAGTLASGGMFRWFKGDWRVARKQVLSFAANAQLKYPSLVLLLDDLAMFVGKRRKLEDNARYKEAVGDHFQGLETDLAALESLRAWYKRVRQQYGVGFGQKVPLGDAILELSPSIAKAVRSLAERGMQAQLNDLLDDLGSLKEVFAPAVELRNEDALLVGEEGAIPHLLSAVNEAIRACGPLTSDDSLSMMDLADRIEQIGVLKHRVEKWQKADFDRKIFQGRLGLKAGVGVDNTVGLSMLRNTLALAACVDGQLNNQPLVGYIYGHPAESTFVSLASHAEQFRVTMTSQQESYDAFAAMVRLDGEGWTVHSGDRLDDLIPRNQLALDNGETLQNWLDYVRVRDQVEVLGLGGLADGVERSEFEIEQVEDAYKAGIFDVLAREILREDPELGRFSGHSQEALQDKFKEYDNRLKQLQCEQIAWKIDQTKIPTGNMAARVSELTERVLLERECSKKTRHIPIRQLLQRASSALVALKPCFMMGPMSVAQYLAPGEIDFDLVVMDEASQIKPQDALGAVARGGQLVVVGDPKQLPPTSFFDRIVEGDEDDPTGIEESESILDATLPMFLVRRLRWHYRSQHESLIAFSNHSFYESDLVLFPSPHKQTENYGVQYSRVSRGCFVNRRNMEEAKIISEAVREHFRHRPDETLGVVAMSAEQRLQIERAIETLAKDDAVFQEWLDDDSMGRESLFVKNLENVQGDERDVIFISMTYGPQEPGGRVFQRFGPINSDVGWRRLNVLFTRSKKRMHIFSSMGSDDIVAGATSKRGVQALRDFLSFCETGILHKTERETGRGADSDFEIAVMNSLRDEGFECIPQVGVAGFFIDVAVVDPGNPGSYLMGIECDGATYHSAKSARDRDRLRQTILERLGWNIRRIWSTDWFKNPHGELRPIIRELHDLKSAVVPVEAEMESEVDEIEEIIEKADAKEAQVDLFAFDESSLKDKLIRFDQEVIRREFPETPENKQLLRPAMLEALLEFMPTSKVEFLESIPPYIRKATETEEARKYLEQVFNIINASMDEA